MVASFASFCDLALLLSIINARAYRRHENVSMNLHTVLAEGNGYGTSIFNSVEHDGNTIQSFTGFVEA